MAAVPFGSPPAPARRADVMLTGTLGAAEGTTCHSPALSFAT